MAIQMTPDQVDVLAAQIQSGAQEACTQCENTLRATIQSLGDQMARLAAQAENVLQTAMQQGQAAMAFQGVIPNIRRHIQQIEAQTQEVFPQIQRLTVITTDLTQAMRAAASNMMTTDGEVARLIQAAGSQ